MTASHQTVRLARGRHLSPHLGACVMELASMLAGERFSDRPTTASPVIAAFLRTYNDGLDDERRQDLYPLASLIVGTAGSRGTERERMSRCLEFARSLGAGTPGGRAAIGIASAEGSGSWAALAALRDGPSSETHARAVAFVGDLAAARAPLRRWRVPKWVLGRDPGKAVVEVLARRGENAGPGAGAHADVESRRLTAVNRANGSLPRVELPTRSG